MTHSAKFSKNSFIEDNKFASRMMTLFIFKVTLTDRYFSFFFFFIRNQKFRYNSWQDSRISFYTLSFIIFIITSMRTLRIWNSELCHALWEMILISADEATSCFIRFISKNSQAKTIFLLYSIFVNKFFFFSHKKSSIFILCSLSDLRRALLIKSENLRISHCAYWFVEFTILRIDSFFKISAFHEALSSEIESSKMHEFTNRTF
jgi:hypothetical protein